MFWYHQAALANHEVAASLPNGFHDAELQRFEIEPPDVNYPWLKAGRIRIDAGEGQPPQSSSTLPVAPAGTRTTWMYLGELNTFLLFSAGNASLEWTGPEVDRP